VVLWCLYDACLWGGLFGGVVGGVGFRGYGELVRVMRRLGWCGWFTCGITWCGG